MIKACIIGISGFGQTHYNDLIREYKLGRIQPVGATVINQDEEAEKCAELKAMGCTLYTDYEEMLAIHGDEAELCCIPTGIPMHAPMSIAAMKAGMNVFVEKPLTSTVQEGQSMIDAAKETGKFCAVGYQSMYASETMPMKRIIMDGQLGDIECIKCYVTWPRPETYYNRNAWAGELQLGDTWVLDSPFNNAVSHQLNMLMFLAGKTQTTSATIASVQAELYRANDISSPDTAAIRLRTDTGLPLYFLPTHACENTVHPHIWVRGTKGDIHWHLGSHWSLNLHGQDEIKFTIDEGPSNRPRMYDAFLSRINGIDAFICTPEIAINQTLVTNAAHQSSPVRPIDAQYFERKEFKNNHFDSHVTVIHDIDAIMKRAFDEEKLFSELDVPWAVPAEEFDVSNYTEFTGLKAL